MSIRFSGLRSSCACLILIGVLVPSAAQADPLYLPTPMGTVLHAADLSVSDMRARLIAALGQPDSRVIVNFNRASLGQEGEGHFSPLVAYDAASATRSSSSTSRATSTRRPGWTIRISIPACGRSIRPPACRAAS